MYQGFSQFPIKIGRLRQAIVHNYSSPREVLITINNNFVITENLIMLNLFNNGFVLFDRHILIMRVWCLDYNLFTQ